MALLTGLAGADRAMAAPATPAAMGSMLLLAESGQQSETTDNDRRPVTTTPPRRTVTSGRKPRKTAPPHLPGLLIGSDRALE
ncbi:hypothetical protein [Sphingopyxis sp. Root1497]|uniref:hypothetical protein n=1 Tax=Sphingopyxis sp. Root1497 TaxID=1736474 RepID=UPI001F3F3DD1|nr:hypothetical protein [Sphingopyxis sp. Root1497]